MRLSNRQRLLIIALTAITLGLLWPPYRDGLRKINQTLLTNISSDAQAADDEPRSGVRFRLCPGRILPSDHECGPWHYADELPWPREDR
jgi:hypothetical protein